jgi:hypothetical protein
VRYIEVALVGLGMIAVGWGVELARSAVQRNSTVDTGVQERREHLETPERDALFYAVVRQQRSAFGLVWFSISIIVMLSAALVGRIFTTDHVGYAILLNAATIIAAALLAYNAYRLYRRATARLHSIITVMTRQM